MSTSCVPAAAIAQNKSERCPNPYFPLHLDVLCAAVREMLILDGRVDAKTLNVRKRFSADGRSDQMKSENGGIATPRDSGVDIVPPECCRNNCVPGDRYDSAEDLVMSIIGQAFEKTSVLYRDSNDDDKEVSLCESYQRKSKINSAQNHVVSTQTKRKVSDVDETCHYDAKAICRDEFPSHVVQLVRSNVVVLNRTSSGQYTGNQTISNSSSNPLPAISDVDVERFLRSPRFQRRQDQQQQNSDNATVFALPRLLQTSIANEVQLRKVTQSISESIIGSNNLDAALRVFLGYKTSKSVDRNKLISIFSDILFDVSHAMYAWVQTENEMNIGKTDGGVIKSTKKAKRVQVPTASRSPADAESIIKQSLFDQRTLKRLGGFEPSSLLPLALGVRYCRINNMSWDEYAMSIEGKRAMEVHLQDVVANNDTDTKKQRYNEALFVVGKRRRGRRGRALRVDEIDKDVYAVG